LKTYPSAKDRISGYACDLSSPDLEANIHHLFAQSGDKLDHVVFTAGDELAITKLEDATLERIQKAGLVRFYAPLLVAKHAVKHLNPGPASSITLTTGSVSEKPNKHWTVVASYATGLHGMIRNLALDLAPTRVNLISKSWCGDDTVVGWDAGGSDGRVHEDHQGEVYDGGDWETGGCGGVISVDFIYCWSEKTD